MKYDKVVEMNQKIGKQNARIVEKEIERMIENGERVTVAALQRYTGFSNSFFYKNKLVREILYEAIRKQNQCYKNNLTSYSTRDRRKDDKTTKTNFTAGVREEEVAWGESKVERGVWDFRKGEKRKWNTTK